MHADWRLWVVRSPRARTDISLSRCVPAPVSVCRVQWMSISYIYSLVFHLQEIYVGRFKYAFSSISLSASSSVSGTDCRQISYSWRMSSSAWRCSSFCSYERLKLLKINHFLTGILDGSKYGFTVYASDTPLFVLTIISFSCCCGTVLWYCSSDAVSSICNNDWSKTSKLLCNVSSKSACGKVWKMSMLWWVSKKKHLGGIEFELEFDKSKLTQIRIIQLFNAGLV